MHQYKYTITYIYILCIHYTITYIIYILCIHIYYHIHIYHIKFFMETYNIIHMYHIKYTVICIHITLNILSHTYILRIHHINTLSHTYIYISLNILCIHKNYIFYHKHINVLCIHILSQAWDLTPNIQEMNCNWRRIESLCGL